MDITHFFISRNLNYCSNLMEGGFLMGAQQEYYLNLLVDYPELMKAEDVGKFFDKKRRFGYELMKQTDFPTTEIGRLKYVTKINFANWLANQVNSKIS